MSEGATFRSGEKCVTAGKYVFVQYADGLARAQPANQERVISLAQGQGFPPIASTGANALWRLMRGDER
jgi:hypothetical protein